ncbi:MAG: hypothetical protein MI919_32550, partial [Holophagales bacterium]|nr:hypothetical protein [Holophagales bacterium]
VARDVQRRTGLSEGRISIAEVGLDAIRERLRRRGGEPPLPVALLGVSAMTERAAEELVADGVPVVFVNRTPENAAVAAERFGAVARSLDVFRRQPEAVEAIISATGASEPVLDAEALRRVKGASPRSPLVLDFGIPADVDAGAAESAGLPYLGMDALNRRAERNRARRQSEAAHARRLVDEALEQLRHRMAQHTLGPVLSELGRRYRETADTGLDKLFRRQLRHLGEGEREAVRRYAHNLAKRLAHVPIAGLRALAGEHGSAPLETFLAAADPLLHEQLEAARERDDLFRVAPDEPE